MMRTTTARAAALGLSVLTGAACALGVSTAAQAAPAAAHSARAVTVPSDLRLVRTLTSLTGTHRYYDQTFRGLPVIDGFWIRHSGSSALGGVVDGRLKVPAGLDIHPSVSASAASRTGVGAVSAKARADAGRVANRPKANRSTDVAASGAARLAVWVSGGSAHLVWRVPTASSSGEGEAFVDAKTGRTLSTRQTSKDAARAGSDKTGTGRVFSPNPVVSLRDESLTDRGNRDYPALQPGYRTVTLNRLDGSGHLSGDFANVFKAEGGLATSASGSFLYGRNDPRFEQVNAYYSVTKAQAYIHDLGFTDVNNEPQRLSIDTVKIDNSYYSLQNDKITFGTGGVDDAEDQEVVWHEYGHAIQDAIVPGYGASEQAGATGEGFGDYWAVTMSIPTSNGYQLPCVADWDSTGYTSGPIHCLRRTDTGKTTDDIVGEVHADGEIWSNALWDINRGIGREQADRVILESTFYYTKKNSFAYAATQVVATANALYGPAAANVARKAFQDRKIL